MKQETLQHYLKQARCLCCALFFIAILPAPKIHAQSLEWALSPISYPNMYGGSFYESGAATATDDSGNVYVTGQMKDSIDFDPGSGTAILYGNSTDGYAYIAKYDAAGNYLWAKLLGGYYPDTLVSIATGTGITIDDSGYVYITGHFSGDLDFDPGPGTAILTSTSIEDIFIAKYDAQGNYIWATCVTSYGSYNFGYRIIVDNSAVYISGDLSGAIGTLYSNGSTDGFVAKYDKATGNYIWAHAIGGGNTDRRGGVAIDKQGNVYATGMFIGTVDFDPSGNSATLTSYGPYDAYVVKYDGDGNYLWAIQMGGDNPTNTGEYDPSGLRGTWGSGIAVDTSGNAYVTGHFVFTADFDPSPNSALLTSSGIAGNAAWGYIGTYIAKYDADGNYIWAHNIDSTSDDYVDGDITLDDACNVYLTGSFSNTSDFDPGPGTALLSNQSSGNKDAFIVKYDSSGNYRWAKALYGQNTNSKGTKGEGVTTDKSGNVFITGYFAAASCNFTGESNSVLTANSSEAKYNIFLLKLGCDDTTSSVLNISTCQSSYTLGDSSYSQPGTYTQVLRNASGCDSTITLNLSFYQLEPIINVNEFVLGTTQSYATYQWILNGEAIPGATNATYTVSENGDYQVAVTSAEGCSDTSAVYTVTNATGLENIPGIAGYIKVYPNPAKDVVYIESPVPVNAVLTAVDGKAIIRANHTKSLSLSGLAEGVYFLQLRDKNNHLLKVEKIVKQQ